MAEPTAEEAAFLEAIRAHPDEDGPRLVYADWLEERGDPRGDFIRTHCLFQDLAGRLDYPDRPRNWDHLSAYLPAVRDWLGPVPPGLAVALDRGLPEARMPLMSFVWVELPPPGLLAWLVSLELFAHDSSTRLAEPPGGGFPNHGWLAALPPVRIDLSRWTNQYTDAIPEGLTALPSLVGLNLSGHRGARNAFLATLRGRDELTDLVLARAPVTDAGLEHLAGLTGLRSLGLAGTTVTDAGLDQLIRLRGLRRLDLRGTRVTAVGVERLQHSLPDCRIVCDPHIDPRYRRLHAWRGLEPGW